MFVFKIVLRYDSNRHEDIAVQFHSLLCPMSMTKLVFKNISTLEPTIKNFLMQLAMTHKLFKGI
jgi:hypothetical protein